MNYKTKLFLILWLAGFAGILSLLLLDLAALIDAMPIPQADKLNLPPIVFLKVVSLI